MTPTSYLLSLTWATFVASAPNILPRQGNGDGSTVIASPNGISGNVLQVPVSIPINLCGDTVSVIGLLNPAFGNACVNNRRREIGLEELQMCYVEASYDRDCETYTFKVPEGVEMNVCGCQVGPGRLHRAEQISCGKDDCVTIG